MSLPAPDPTDLRYRHAPTYSATAAEARSHGICQEGDRPTENVTKIVAHSTEGPNDAWGVARCMSGGGCSGSVHAIASPDVGVRLLADAVVACGAPPYNFPGVHIEQCGFSAWSRLTWMLPRNRRTIDRTAAWIARALRRHELPNVFGTERRVRRFGMAFEGYTVHRIVSLVFRKSSHTDPGPPDRKHYPYWYLRHRVTLAYDAEPVPGP